MNHMIDKSKQRKMRIVPKVELSLRNDAVQVAFLYSNFYYFHLVVWKTRV